MRRAVLYPVVVLFGAVWNSAFVAGKIGTAGMDPFVLLAWRFGLTALALFPVALWRGGLFAFPAMRAGALLGLFYNAAYLGLTFAALRVASATVVILIVGLSPFGTALLAAAAGRERLSGRMLAGMALGFGGVAVIALGQDVGQVTARGVGLAGCGMLAFCLGTVFYQGRARAVDAVQLNFWQSAAGCVILSPLAAYFGQGKAAWTVETAGVALYLALVVGIGGMGLWFFLIRTSGAATASAYHLLNPVFALAYGRLVFGAPVALRDVAGAGLVFLGLAMVRPQAARAGGTSGDRTGSGRDIRAESG